MWIFPQADLRMRAGRRPHLHITWGAGRVTRNGPRRRRTTFHVRDPNSFHPPGMLAPRHAGPIQLNFDVSPRLKRRSMGFAVSSTSFGQDEEATLTTTDELRADCWNEALHCFGTSYIFETRTNRLRRRLRFLTFLGVVVPSAIGAAATSFGVGSRWTTAFLVIGAVVGLVQLVMSVWALSYRWEDDFAYASESQSANRVLYCRFKELATRTSDQCEYELARRQYELIQTESSSRSGSDEKQGITEKEKRMGMRAALRQMRRPCAACELVPTSMDATNCDVCGRF